MGVLFGLPLIGFFCTTLLLFLYLKFSHQNSWFDKPDEERKLHAIAIPTSAGIVFMAPIVLLHVFLPQISLFPPLYINALLLMLIIAGAYDDFKSLSVRIRFVLISLVSSLLIAFSFEFESLNYLVLLVYFLGVVWWMNLYNFMDGADGMAILHALVSVFAYCVYFFLFSDMELLFIIYLLFIIACLFAFLLFNFPRARIFMGDSGSLSLSFLIAAIALYGIANGMFNEWVVISFHLVFIVDATLTLFTRIKYKHSMTQAHNLHLFQALIATGKSHALVSIYYASVSVIIVLSTLLMKFIQSNQMTQVVVLLLETIVLGVYWYKFHNKTKFERFIR